MNISRHNMLNVIMWAFVACFCTSAFGGTMSSDRYYTWGISGDDLDIPDGSIITEAVLTIHGITNWDNNLNIHIVDNPPLDFVANIDDGSGDFFQDFDGLLSGYNYELVDGDLVITFSQINEENSWVWDIFDDPLEFQTDYSLVSYSSSLLELIDYAGNSTPFGIAFDPEESNYSFDKMTLDLTVESYEGQSTREAIVFTSMGTILLADDFDDRNYTGWSVVDDGATDGPSSWSADDGAMVQSSNIHTKSSGIAAFGTYALYEAGIGWTDYRAGLTLRSEDNDSIGVMFRYQDSDNYYRFSWNRQKSYRRLVKCQGGQFTVLAEDSVAYVTGQTYQLEIVAQGGTLQVSVDGSSVFSVNDNSLSSGTIALYTGGNTGGYFDDIAVEIF